MLVVFRFSSLFIDAIGFQKVVLEGLDSMFVDRVEVEVIAGRGGNGCMAFRRKSTCHAAVPMAGMAVMVGASSSGLGLVSIRWLNSRINGIGEPRTERLGLERIVTVGMGRI